MKMASMLPLLLTSLVISSAFNPVNSGFRSLPSLTVPSVPSIPSNVGSIPDKLPGVSTVVDARDAVVGNVTKASGGIGRGVKKEIQAAKQPIDETIAYIGSSQCAHVKKIIGVAYEQYEGEQEPRLDKLTLEYRDSGIRTIYNITTAAARIPLAREFNPKQKLYIVIHGFHSSPNKRSFQIIIESLLKEGNCNVLAFDGSSLIRWLYLRSTTYVRFMGERLGEVLAAMVNKGVEPSSIHIIGHSLGAHISGFTGKTFADLTGSKVGRISGLDPAGPCFSHVEPELRLKATDAEFVDVIHKLDIYPFLYAAKPTICCLSHGVIIDQDGRSPFSREVLTKIGQVDYYPNSGALQPNCLFQTCSHRRAWVYYAESITNPDAFSSMKCKDWDAFKKNQCESAVSPMGFGSEPGTTGLYFLQTSEDSPYGRGKEGLRWKNNEAVIRNVANHVFG